MVQFDNTIHILQIEESWSWGAWVPRNYYWFRCKAYKNIPIFLGMPKLGEMKSIIQYAINKKIYECATVKKITHYGENLLVLRGYQSFIRRFLDNPHTMIGKYAINARFYKNQDETKYKQQCMLCQLHIFFLTHNKHFFPHSQMS
jgi:hypothetical protein